MKHLIAIVGLCFLAACATRPEDLGREPGMTPVGSGVAVQREPLPHLFKGAGPSAANSTWSNASAASPRKRHLHSTRGCWAVPAVGRAC